MIEIGKILKPHSIHGEIKVQLFSDNFDAFCDRGFAYIKQAGTHRRLLYDVVRISPPYVYITVDGVTSRNDAEAYRGVLLWLNREDFGETDTGEYYICDLIGMSIVDETGQLLGALKEVLQHGAADVYVVSAENGFMFPALRRVIKTVDLDKGEICVDTHALSEVAVYDR